MGSNPVNLALRFVLELAALAVLAVWGWSQHEGIVRVLLAVGLPLLGGVVWAVFRVPGDGGAPIIVVSGVLRLLIELVLFAFAASLLYSAGQQTVAIVFAIVVIVHYVLSYDRVGRLLRGS